MVPTVRRWPTVAMTKRAEIDARRRALRQSAARARHDAMGDGSASGPLALAGQALTAPVDAAHARCAAMQLVQEEHGLCHSLLTTPTIHRPFAFISV
ncbi:hypothetical protein C0Z18_05110 [Trinickia dabaoshanensis]|uniref:Uncharacterized protein n=2 Tax=Trinickia dabaoshanensis TaxID=564714 RepID=A0A2N7VZV7_9BURK|nr:hypothetical protein C0Z18_05110 [Trinickia dabaoshanensis]